ncbi:uncharacterized protein LOC108253857, partial [Diaphorina citri]|uniref:Uncharacterized protein LOC108253857 n=1 Tax=Diaphorina citri TaxID=121845 RepID=A0A1S4EPF1_DIACI
NQIAELETANWSPEIQNKLTTLFIGENHIHQIENLNGFRSILWLNMDSNLLQTLDSLPKTMETLSVANNYLVNYLELNRMTSLKWIVLSNNYIKEFVIPNRKHIEKLDLSNNLISTINLNLNNTYYIKDLILSYNQISKLNANTFRNLNVFRLYLKFNKISEIHDFAFNGIVENEIIDQNMLFNSNAGIMSEDEQYVNDEPINERTSHGGPILDETLNVNSDSIIDEYAPNHDTHERIKSKTTESYSNKYTDSLNIINDSTNLYEDLSKYASQLNTFYENSKNKKRHYKAKNLNSKINVQQFSFPREQHTHKTNPDSNDEKTYSTDKTINRINDRTHVKRRRYKHYNDHNYNKYVRYKKNIISTNKTLDDEDTVDKNRYKNSINDIN